MKTLTTRQVAALKRNALNVSSLITKRNNLQFKMENLSRELELLRNQIDTYESASRAITGGYTTEDLLKRVVTSYENGAKTAKYEPREDALVFNDETRLYEITIVELEEGSDYDIDEKAEVPVKEETIQEGFNPTEF